MVVGGVITVLLLVFIIVAGIKQDEVVLFTNAIYSFYMLWVPFIVFGLYPLIKGATRFIEASNVPAQAVAQPVAKPATETVAEAPKAPAKKTASKAKTTKTTKATKEAK